ncbi:MAG: TrkH family potassium uptake protein [Ruminococcaceae bacterium]|nr:TrkH family potassium uptake protein [Oscillospiraceae bacterium]
MNYKIMCRFLSLVCLAEAVFMLPALAISIYDSQAKAVLGFVATICIAVALYITLKILSRNNSNRLTAREGFVCTAASWVLMSLIGSLPFVISGEIPRFIDALFEIVSGFTTTGASILADVEALSRGILYWRSFSHWVGGMGVLVFLLALVPGGKKSEGFTMHLFRAESPGPEVGKLVPKLRQTAIYLYGTYMVLSVLNFTFLMLGDMNWFEALCTMFGTAGTGGFGVRGDSIGSFSPYIQNVTTVFMLLFGVNFSCYYLIILRQFRSVIRDEELRLYFSIVAVSILLITWNIAGMYDTLGEGLRHAAFQVASIISTTGYSTVDFDLWPTFSKGILTILMITGACAGSTCGGMKCARVLLLFKGLRRNIRQMVHPNRVEVVRVNGRAVDEKVMSGLNGYLSAYVLILFLSFVVICFDDFSIGTNISAVLACFNNIGPGFETVGPMENFGNYSVLSKLVLTFDMLAGRLEIFPILLFFAPGSWKKN